MSNKRYLIIGTGGVGGSIAGFLALNGQDVTCIARGKHLDMIRQRGLRLISTLKGEHSVSVNACTSEEYTGKADIIFVCVKGYSIDSVAELIKKASHEDTLIIPILNVYETGPRIQNLVDNTNVLDGCIYIVSFVSSPGEITQMGQIFRLVYGARKEQNIPYEKLEEIQKDLISSGIKAEISPDINRDTFIKWSYISAMACTGAYYDVPMREIQKPGEERNTFIGLSDESQKIGKKLGVIFPENLVDFNLKVLDKLDPESTASMQKDIAKGHQSEISGLLFAMIEKAKETNTLIPTYEMIAKKFKKLQIQ